MFWLVQYKYQHSLDSWNTSALEIDDSKSTTATGVAEKWMDRYAGDFIRIRVAPAGNPPKWTTFDLTTELVQV